MMHSNVPNIREHLVAVLSECWYGRSIAITRVPDNYVLWIEPGDTAVLAGRAAHDELGELLHTLFVEHAGCPRCKHLPHVGSICMFALYWDSKHDADCGCPLLVCYDEHDYTWPSDTPEAWPASSMV